AKIKDTTFGDAQFGKSPFLGEKVEEVEEDLRGVAISIVAKFSYAAQFSEQGAVAASLAPAAVMAAELEGL
ncbi:hypothetical protein LCGC14_1868350, partial [marine sediment metagenome]